ncbi:MAG: hypothetical protein PBU43_18685 [Microvirgula aerodenitrificans]
MSVSAATGIGLGILGILLGIVSLGMSVMVAMTMMGTVLAATSALLGLVSSATGIAAAVVEESGTPDWHAHWAGHHWDWPRPRPLSG